MTQIELLLKILKHGMRCLILLTELIDEEFSSSFLSELPWLDFLKFSFMLFHALNYSLF